jgi:hypothetical protein
LLACSFPAFAARADEPAPATPPKAEKAQPERVHLGSASVTVVDEHEAVDDVITRIRNGKIENPVVDKSKTVESHGQGAPTATAADTRQGNGRSSLRTQRDRASARAEADRTKDERRERAATTRTRLEQKQRR